MVKREGSIKWGVYVLSGAYMIGGIILDKSFILI